MNESFLLLALLVATPSGQEISDEAQYRERMHDVDHSFSVLRERPVKDMAAIEAEAAKLQKLFAEVEAFWKGRGDEERASFARMAKDGAEELGRAAASKNEQGLDAATETIARSCEGCHREPLDKYRLPKD
jgi:cytochrome c556